MECPTGKVSHRYERTAWIAAYKLFQKDGRELSVYLCPRCSDYHATTKKAVIPNWLKDMIKNNEI